MKSKIQFIFLLSSLYTAIVVASCDITPELVDFPNFVNTNSGPVSLTASPAGGIFSGNGVLFNAFNATLAGPGVHEITYSYTDPDTGCVSQVSGTILVFTLIEVWVSYSLGTVQPKLSIGKETYVEKFDDYDLIISDTNGRMLHHKKSLLNQTQHFNQISEIDLPLGVYVVTLQNHKHIFSKQVVLGR